MNADRTISLGDVVSIKHGFAFPGSKIVTEEQIRILVTPGHFEIGGGFRNNHKKYFASDDYKIDYELEAGDLIVTMTDLSKAGDTLGYAAIVPDIKNKILLHNQRIGKVLFNSNELDKGFCHYLLRSPRYRHHVLSTSTGSTVKHTSPKKILDFQFTLPPQHHQKVIAHILGTLDDKIALNQKMNQTLEEIAKAIFKSWFIDFDPVRAKTEGRPTGLPPEISNLFPDELMESEIGEIPKGWQAGTFSRFLKIQGGFAFKSSDFGEEGFKVVKIKNIHSNGTVNLEDCDRVKVTDQKLDRFLLFDGNVIIAMTGATVGKVGLISINSSKIYLNQRVGRVVPNIENNVNCWFSYLSLSSNFAKKEIELLAYGSAQPNISSKDIEGIR